MIDTPGVLDTSTVERLKNLSSEKRYVQKEILKELHKIFSWAPTGFDAIMLVVKFGCRFTDEDGQALRLLIDFLGERSLEYMILTLTYADQVKNEAEEENISEEECVSRWKSKLPEWVKEFIKDINDRVVLFDNTLKESKDPTGYKKQLTKLIEVSSVFFFPVCERAEFSRSCNLIGSWSRWFFTILPPNPGGIVAAASFKSLLLYVNEQKP